VSPADVESCNGLDDDCDGGGDETFECPQGSTATPCTTSCGSTGVARCSDSCTIDSCVPPVESCSYVDDDCDGEIDEGLQSVVPSRDYGMGTAALRTWTFGGEAPVVFGLYSGDSGSRSASPRTASPPVRKWRCTRPRYLAQTQTSWSWTSHA
jgi:hypothetical protein